MALVDSIREQVLKGPYSVYETARRAEIDTGNMSRFVRGKAGLSLAALDRLGEVLALQVVSRLDDTGVSATSAPSARAPVEEDRPGSSRPASSKEHSGGRIRHSPETRSRAIDLLRAGESPAEVAHRLAVPAGTVHAWAYHARKAGALD